MKKEDSETRRDLIKMTIGAAVGVVAIGETASALGADVKLAPRGSLALNNRAVLPGGREMTRGEILQSLNLNPKTPPEAWLSITSCGSNAAGLNFHDAEALSKMGKLDAQSLEAIRGFSK
jgi:hypothetical protein